MANRLVDWAHNGGQRGRHSSMLSAPLRSTHGRRYAVSAVRKLGQA